MFMRRLFTFTLLALSLPLAAAKPPRWMAGADPAYPERDYLIGVGIGTDLDDARGSARAEIGKIFQARVQQTTEDVQTESSASAGRRRGAATGTQKIETTTRVATDALLEGVQIAQTYFDKKKKKHYALAVLDKKAARRALAMQITDKEEGIRTRLTEAEDAATPLDKAKALNIALALALERDALATRQRVVDPAGGIPALADGGSTAEIERSLNEALRGISFSVKADGGRLKQAIQSRVTELGFKVSDAAPLHIESVMDVQPFDRGHEKWKFYHWEGTLTLTDAGKTIASATPSGEEGHLMEATAQKRSREAGEQEMAREAQKLISKYVFGE
jgi:hypothetical protein